MNPLFMAVCLKLIIYETFLFMKPITEKAVELSYTLAHERGFEVESLNFSP